MLEPAGEIDSGEGDKGAKMKIVSRLSDISNQE
jgi:hypothetical protein